MPEKSASVCAALEARSAVPKARKMVARGKALSRAKRSAEGDGHTGFDCEAEH